MTTHHDHEDCTGWNLGFDNGRVAHYDRCEACNPDGQYPPEAAPWTELLIVDGRTVALYGEAVTRRVGWGIYAQTASGWYVRDLTGSWVPVPATSRALVAAINESA